VILTWPLVWLSGLVSGLFKKGQQEQLPRSEVVAMAELGLKEGAIDRDESRLIRSTLKFREIDVNAVMTPINAVTAIKANLSMAQALKRDIPFSRIPLYDENKTQITGYVLKDDVHDAHAKNQGVRKVGDLKRDISRIPVNAGVAEALRMFSRQRSHIAVVENEGGEACGIITLEDAIETLLGLEIVDEFDPAVDMRNAKQEERNS
jgi:CBS domain containing-hemolysin-like protein